MVRKRSVSCVIALAIALALPVVVAQGKLGAITFAEGEENAEPVGVRDAFPAGTELVYAFFRFEGLTETDVVAGSWYFGDELLIAQAHTVAQGLGRYAPEGDFFFALRLPDGAAPGRYRLEISLAGTVQQSASFEVEGADAAAPTFDLPALTQGPGPDGTVSALHRYPAGVSGLQLLVAHRNLSPGTSWGWRVGRHGRVLEEERALHWDGPLDGLELLPLDIAWEPGIYDLELFLGETTMAASVVVGDAEPSDLSLVDQDAFDGNDGGWGTAENERGRVAVEDGRMVIAMATRDAPAWSVNPSVHGDVVIEVDATTIGGPDDNAYGVVVRFQDGGNFHALLASADGYYAAVRFVDGRLQWDRQWARDALFGKIALGRATNRLRVLAVGDLLRFYVNDRLLFSVPAGWRDGQAGVFAASLGEPGAEVAFDDWRVWDVEAVAAAPTDGPALALDCEQRAQPLGGQSGSPPLLVACPAGCPESGPIWGTDVYTDDSRICLAAVHAGVLPPGEAGTVRLYIVAGQSAYEASTRNGVTSASWGSWGRSFRLERP